MMRLLRKERKWLSIILLACLIISMTPSAGGKAFAAANENETAQSEEKSDQEVPEGYKPIYDGDDLYAIRDDLSAKYILMNDIDLSESTAEGGNLDFGNGWEPIQNFRGELDGNGYRIIGMHIFGDMNGKNVGLFGSVYASEEHYDLIHNLGLIDCDITVNNAGCTGAVMGKLYACYNHNAKYGWRISDCYITGKINSDSSYTGGIIGYMDNEQNYTGMQSIEKSYNEATITGSGSYIGGFVGGIDCERIDFSQCYYAGKIEKENKTQDGAFLGILYTDYDVYPNEYYASCYYINSAASRGDGERSDDSTGIKSYSEKQMQNQKLYTGFDFAETWEFDSFCRDYLYPQLKANRQIRAKQIQITQMPSKTSYQQCDEEDFSDGKIKIIYENGVETELPMTKAVLSGYDMDMLGKQEVTVSYAGCEVNFSIEVSGVDVTEVTLDQEELQMNIRQTEQLTASIAPENASNKEIIWESSDPSVATVSSTGMVQAIARGSATITAYSYDKTKSAECEVEVLVPSVEISIDQKYVKLSLGEDVTLVAEMLPFETTDMVEWSSANSKVATVDEMGKVTAVGGGVTTITATADSGVESECTIEVKIPASGVALSEKTKTLSLGESAVLQAELVPAASTDKLRWTSEDEDIVSVNDEGKIIAYEVGTTRIMVYTENYTYSDSCLVTVTDRVATPEPSPNATVKPSDATSSVKLLMGLNYYSKTLSIGDTLTLKATGTDDKKLGNTRLTWSSSDANIASVDTEGVVTAWAEGTVTITVQDNKGEYDPITCQIIVQHSDATENAKKIKVKIKSVSKIKKNSARISFSVSDSSATSYELRVYCAGKLVRDKEIGACSSYVLRKLKKNKKYTVRVRAITWIDVDYVYGSWSASKKFKTKK